MIQENVYTLNIPHAFSTVTDILTVSIGVVSIKPTKDILPSFLVEAADNAMYKAKQKGKNEIIMKQCKC